MRQKTPTIPSLIFSDVTNFNNHEEIFFMIYCSIIKHLQTNNSLKGWRETLNLKDLEILNL